MVQTVVNEKSREVFQGMPQDAVERTESYLLSENATVGHLLSYSSTGNLLKDTLVADLYTDGATHEVAGILYAEVSIPSALVTDQAQVREAGDAVPVARKGRIWVELVAALTDLNAPVYVVDGTGVIQVTGTIVVPTAKWKASKTENSKYWGLVEINLP